MEWDLTVSSRDKKSAYPILALQDTTTMPTPNTATLTCAYVLMVLHTLLTKRVPKFAKWKMP
jgi:hypothetical protein